jgi:outer membrane protein assembly factor BamB
VPLRPIIACLVLLSVPIAPVPAAAWTRRLTGDPRPMVANARDTVFGVVPRVRRPAGPTIVALSTANGTTRWRRGWRGMGRRAYDVVAALAVAPDGDLVVAGSLTVGTQGDFAVARFDGRTGRQRWQTLLAGVPQGWDQAVDVAVTPDGDVVAVGGFERQVSTSVLDPVIVMLDGASGRERWRLPGLDPFTGKVRVGSDGAIFVAGGTPMHVVRVATAGVVTWASTVEESIDVRDVAVGAYGEVVVVGTMRSESGSLDNAFGVVSLSADTGDVRWTTRRSRGTRHWEAGLHVVIGADGAVYAAGLLDDDSGSYPRNGGNMFAVLRLDGSSGVVDWEYATGGAGFGGFLRAITLLPDGGVVAVGSTQSPVSCGDGYAVALDSVSGAARWSARIDGSFVARDCSVECYHGYCPVDDDGLSGVVVDGEGRLLVSGATINAAEPRVEYVTFLRELTPR